MKAQLEHEKQLREREQSTQEALLREKHRLERERSRIEARIQHERQSNQHLID
jgi:hypothetical protein